MEKTWNGPWGRHGATEPQNRGKNGFPSAQNQKMEKDRSCGPGGEKKQKSGMEPLTVMETKKKKGESGF